MLVDIARVHNKTQVAFFLQIRVHTRGHICYWLSKGGLRGQVCVVIYLAAHCAAMEGQPLHVNSHMQAATIADRHVTS